MKGTVPAQASKKERQKYMVSFDIEALAMMLKKSLQADCSRLHNFSFLVWLRARSTSRFSVAFDVAFDHMRRQKCSRSTLVA